MKFVVTFKTPNALDDIIDYEEFENEEEREEQREALQVIADKFLKYGELISIEFDTEVGTAKVLKV